MTQFSLPSVVLFLPFVTAPPFADCPVAIPPEPLIFPGAVCNKIVPELFFINDLPPVKPFVELINAPAELYPVPAVPPFPPAPPAW